MTDDTQVPKTDAILWYNVGVFGEAGFAVPNPSNDPTTLNNTIAELVSVIGRNLLAMNTTEDAGLRVPPSINRLMEVHRLVIRVRQIIAARSVPHNEPMFEADHVSPAAIPFILYPAPFFKLRNPFLRRWSGLALNLLAEMMQHTENRRSHEISVDFGAMVGRYMARIYGNMGAELFGKTRAQVNEPAFILTDEDFQGYNPGSFFTRTERIDTVAPQRYIFTEDQLAVIANGIDAATLPASVVPWPNTGSPADQERRSTADGGGNVSWPTEG